jgi:hypothetical protein
MTGYLYSNGGSGSGNGGGGAGGRINFFFNQGFYESGHVTPVIDRLTHLTYRDPPAPPPARES